MMRLLCRKGLRAALSVALCAAAMSGALAADQKYPFSIAARRVGDHHVLYATNDGPSPVSTRITFTELDNARSTRGGGFDVLLAPHSARPLGDVAGAKAGERYAFRYTYRWHLGDAAARPDPAAVYRLPFGDGLSFGFSQAPGSVLSTHGEGGQEWAVDIPMPIGTPIVAARAGYVVEVVGEFGEGAPDVAMVSRTNYVRIIHDDGTFAVYGHLLKDSPTVQMGQRVSVGTPLGLSGSSGYSSGPHLHFAVERYNGEVSVTIPFRFYSTTAGAFQPRYGMVVTSDYGSTQLAVSPATASTGGMR